MKKQSFVFGALILGISGIVCKLLGAVYKIPLTNILGSQGIGIYYLVFPVYAFILSMTSSNFTIVISKKISQFISEKKFKKADDYFRVNVWVLVGIGGVASAILIGLSKIISNLQGVENAWICYIIIASAIIPVGVESAFKGYFQGLQNVVPTAISQFIEQIVKFGVGFFLANIMVDYGVVKGVFGALLGVATSEAIGMIFFIIYYLIFKKKNKNYFENKNLEKSFSTDKVLYNKNYLENNDFGKSISEDKISNKNNLFKNFFINSKALIKESIPFTLSSIILPLSLVVDSFLIVNILKSMSFNKSFATSLLGINSGIINTLVGLPSTFSVGICITIIPFITFALGKKDFDSICEKVSLAVKLVFFVAIPCLFVFLFFSKNILELLFAYSFSSIYELELAKSLLMVSSINVFYLSLLQLTTALLQSINRSYVPVISLSISLIAKVILEIVFINLPAFNIFGAVLSNSVCYFLSTAINIVFLKKEIKLDFCIYKSILCPVFASIIMCFVIKGLDLFLSGLIGVVASFIVGGVFFVLSLFLFKGFNKNEIRSFLNVKNNN